MNFYCVYYKRQYFNRAKHAWVNTCYKSNKIIVVANDRNDAIDKIDKCLADMSDSEFRSVSLGDVVECIGLNVMQCAEGGSNVWPIAKESSLDGGDQ